MFVSTFDLTKLLKERLHLTPLDSPSQGYVPPRGWVIDNINNVSLGQVRLISNVYMFVSTF
jgi:hypothetical protein